MDKQALRSLNAWLSKLGPIEAKASVSLTSRQWGIYQQAKARAINLITAGLSSEDAPKAPRRKKATKKATKVTKKSVAKKKAGRTKAASKVATRDFIQPISLN